MKKNNGVFNFVLILLVFLFVTLFSSFAFSETVKIATDPVRIGVGARTLGMGKMGIALGDDCSALFLNPAGIAQLDDWQIMSMTGQFINEISYLQFGGVYKTNYGNFGIGYVGAGLGAEFSKPMLVGGRVVASTEGVSYNFNDAVFLFSYGTKLKDFFDWDWVKDISIGSNLKIFSVGLSGPGVEGGTASGFDMDLGLLYTPLPWLSAGLAGQDILPADSGGKLIWNNDNKTEEVIPAVVKLGVAATLVGPYAPWTYGGHELIAGVDMDFAPTRDDLPALMHLGLEWWPIEYTALRLGVDQDYIGTGDGDIETTNNLTAGVGLLYSGFRFDYAYHQYNDIPENDTHYFSLSYNIFKEKAPSRVDEYVSISQPGDKSVVRDATVMVMGKIMDPRVEMVSVNNLEVKLDSKNAFAIEVPLNPAKNSISVTAFDNGGNLVETKKIRVLRLMSFEDVSPNYWARNVIEQIATLGIVTGYPNGTFKPQGPITRAEVTTLLVRALGKNLENVNNNIFTDLPMTHWAAKYVKEGVNMKYVLGYPDGTFKPSNSINKAEGVILMARFGELKEPDKVVVAPYEDVPGRHWAAPLITAAKQAGYLKYLGEGPFQPKLDLTRAEAVEILSKTKFAKGKISELMDFDKGY